MFRIAQIRLALAAAFGLALLSGLTTASTVQAQGSGTLVPGMITIQGIVAEDTDRAGTYEYLIDVTASFDVADGYRVAGAGEQAYVVVDSTTGNTIDAGETDASGRLVLDGQVGAEFYVYEIDDLGSPIGTDDLFVPADSQNPAVSITGIFYVPGTPESVGPSVAPTVGPSAEPLPSGAASGTILPDAITVQGLVVEDPERAGETDYLINVTAAAETGDFRAARAGEQTYQVVDLSTNAVLDSGTTDANGQVVLDGQVDAAYYVVEVGDTGSIPGSDSLFYPAGDPNAFVALTGVVYVGQIDPEVSPSPSPVVEVSPSPSPVVEVSPSPSPVVDVSPSPAPSLDPVTSPSASPSDVAVPSAEPSASGGASPSEPGASGSASPSVPVTASPSTSVPGQDDDGAVNGAGPSAAGSRDAAPVISERDGISVLPNTGAGPGTPGPSSTVMIALLVALGGIVAAGFTLRRRAA